MPNVEIGFYDYTLAYCCNLWLDAYGNDALFTEALTSKAPQLMNPFSFGHARLDADVGCYRRTLRRIQAVPS